MTYGSPPTDDDQETWDPISPDREGYVELQQAIGHIAWASAELEGQLRFFFYQLMSDDCAFAVAEGETADWLVQKCLRLLDEEHLVPEARQGRHSKTGPALRKAQSLLAIRGAVVHATWAKVKGGRFMARRPRRFKAATDTVYSLDDLHRLADDLTLATREIATDQTYGL
ncbi:MAG: hypothetical protein LC775_13930 [Acidobacteria bacterium]|nr:hypothetical protein [Acidobacteriota bacterium]